MGHRTQEELQSWNGSAWVTTSSRQFVYSTRCHLDRIVEADGAVTEYDYDCDGNLAREWDGNHPSAGKTLAATRVYAYDALDRLTSTTEPWGGAGGGSAVTTYGYDVQDHLVSVTDAEGNVTLYEVSDRDLLTGEDSPVSGVTTNAYDEHGSAVATLDARDVQVDRTYDALDRVTFADFPDAALDTTYVYDDPGVAFSLGRLTAITRGGETLAYGYDRFGRVTQDGELTYGYDANGNRTSVGYPGGVAATYGFDFADREASLTVDDGGGPQAVVTSASYLPGGPLTALALGNGVAESRLFDARYLPVSITATTARDHAWAYSNDAVGNVTSIVETEGCAPTLAFADQTFFGTASFTACDEITAGPAVAVASGADVTFQAGQLITLNSGFSVAEGATFAAVIAPAPPIVDSHTFTYQDVQYFLTSADGAPWGSLAWTYDRIGNRLSEDRNATVDAYTYLSNGTGNTAILTQAGPRTYTTGPAGHLTAINASGNQIDLGVDDAGRIASFARPAAPAQTTLTYDGRGFLRRSEQLLSGGPDIGFTEPTYSTEGLLYALHRQLAPAEPEERVSLFYFAGRAIAQLRQEIGGGSTWLFLSTDHVGTPILATGPAGEEVWHGPFEPFGADFFRASSEAALEKGVLLRLPGQWEDETWTEATLGAKAYYNVHRWVQPATGRYTRPDPLEASPNDYAYVDARPTFFGDPLGLLALDPVSCSPFKNLPGPNGTQPTCCYRALEQAVQQYNEFFTRGWRQRKPECWKRLSVAHLRQGWKNPRGGKTLLTTLSCMIAGHRDEVMKCDFGRGAPSCGLTSDDGQSFFRQAACDRSECGTPFNTLFHERLHRCGAPGEKGGLYTDADEVAFWCAGP
jgi:RHS repeat-associated protein